MLHSALTHWFRRKRWVPFDFQREAWLAHADGRSGLVNAPTGMGKTYAVWLGPVSQWLHENPDWKQCRSRKEAPLRVLWLTPMRALANDTLTSLQAPIRALGLPWTVDVRTGDTSPARKMRQRECLPTCLITTPESLSVMLSFEETEALLGSVRTVIVDEWHELIGTKRGTQTELALARLRRLNPKLQTWGLSATLGNLTQAMSVLVGAGHDSRAAEPALIRSDADKQTEIQTLLPVDMDRFPWSGHIGLRLLPDVIEAVSHARSTLLFTNTRAQAEIWFQRIVAARPRWTRRLALHHGSLDRDLRQAVEDGLRRGRIKCVVCTSSLDLGVDFSPVDQVIQVGSPKGVSRLLQRAGRSGHMPGGVSRILCVPTNAFELVEYAATRQAVESGRIEARDPIERPMDVLVQHLVTLASGPGFDDERLFEEVRSSWSYRSLSRCEWEWALDFVSHGGPALRAYGNFQKVVSLDGKRRVTSRQLARLHRLNIGTITSDMVITVKLQGGHVLGTVEESFVAKMSPGARFVFAGRFLQLVRLKDASAIVRFAERPKGSLPAWSGSRMPITSQLGNAVREKIGEARVGAFAGPEMETVRPILEIQERWSRIPAPDELLIEMVRSREGHHAFVFPFEGHYVNEGLGSLLAWRLSQIQPRSIAVTMNDYGFELRSMDPFGMNDVAWRKLFSPENLLEDLLESLNATELSRRHFREVARVAGLVFSGYPGAPKAARQVHSSSSLLFDVFSKYDPANLLLDQARREVLDRQMEVARLRDAMVRIRSQKIIVTTPIRFTPLAFPLWASGMASAKATLTTEQIGDRIRRMVDELEGMAAEEMALG